jgi:hypothetical protein
LELEERSARGPLRRHMLDRSEIYKIDKNANAREQFRHLVPTIWLFFDGIHALTL